MKKITLMLVAFSLLFLAMAGTSAGEDIVTINPNKDTIILLGQRAYIRGQGHSCEAVSIIYGGFTGVVLKDGQDLKSQIGGLFHQMRKCAGYCCSVPIPVALGESLYIEVNEIKLIEIHHKYAVVRWITAQEK
jgi:hypothetical protein